MTYLDGYASERTVEKLDGFPESTFEIDIAEPKLSEVLDKLSLYFYELREVEKSNGQAIQPLSTMIPYLNGEYGVPRSEGAGKIYRLN